MKLTVGFPRMHKEQGERRDFLPDFAEQVARLGHPVVVEEGIGSGMGLGDAAYTCRSSAIRTGTHQEAYRQDLVLVLRSPEVEEYEARLRRGSIFISMLHFPTRPRRIRKLKELGVEAISLDSIEDDEGRRLVENMRAVAWNGVEAAFDALLKVAPSRLDPGQPPVRVTVMGIGQVGKHAVEAATKYGSLARAREVSRRGGPGVEVTTLGRSLTSDAGYLEARFAQTEILVDATQRSDATRPLISNAQLGGLPKHAVVCDLVVDPYVPTGVPPTVRSLEGIPKGDLDQWIYLPDDPNWSKTIPDGVPTAERRATATCYSWPGVHPEECMRHYARQLWPLLERLLVRGGVEGLARTGDFLDRALWRASLRTWGLDAKPVEPLR